MHLNSKQWHYDNVSVSITLTKKCNLKPLFPAGSTLRKKVLYIIKNLSRFLVEPIYIKVLKTLCRRFLAAKIGLLLSTTFKHASHRTAQEPF